MAPPRALRLSAAALAVALLLPAAEACQSGSSAACDAQDLAMIQRGAHHQGKARTSIAATAARGDARQGNATSDARAMEPDASGAPASHKPYHEPPEKSPLDGRAPVQLLDSDTPPASLLGDGRYLDRALDAISGDATLGLIIFLSVCCPISFYCCVAATAISLTDAKKDMSIDDIRNDQARRMRETFDLECPDDEKKRYCSQDFRDACDEVFNEADVKKAGTMDLADLRGPVNKYLDGEVVLPHVFAHASDKNGDDQINKDEFFEMMKYFAFKKDQKVGPVDD